MVTGMLSTVVMSAGVSVVERWTWIPGWLRPVRPATVTSIRVRLVALSSCRAAAERWDSTAPGPQARTAAMYRPSRLNNAAGDGE